MSVTFGILAHVDHGKTTLSEQILYRAGLLRAVGKVDGKSTMLDHNEIEKERGITVFSDSASFVYKGRGFNLLDTPGHVDFAGEMERSVFALDLAVLVISAVEGVQNHTNTIFGILQEQKVPTIVFINKTDRDGADVAKVIEQIKEKWGVNALDFTQDFKNGEFSAKLCEELCEIDDDLLCSFLESGYEKELWISKASELCKSQKLIAVFSGSAMQGIGIEELLGGLFYLSQDNQRDEEKLCARVYKVSHDKQKNRVTHLKITRGALKTKDILQAGENGEKVNEIRAYEGERFKTVQRATTGDIVGATGLVSFMPGDVIGEGEKLSPKLIPLMRADVNIGKIPPLIALQNLRELESEEPLLAVQYNESIKTISVHIAGKIQLEVLEKLFLQRFSQSISFSDCKIMYKETLKKPVYGCGHFEPLKHYAEVHLLLTPTARGSGITYSSDLSLDVLTQSWQNLVATHVFEKEHLGVLTGSPLTDVHIALKNGRADIKHTEGGDFRQSTYRAIRHGLMCAESELLEPYYYFTITAQTSYTGRILSDIQIMSGSFEPPFVQGEENVIKGYAPVVNIDGYISEFVSFTRGSGRIFLSFGGYKSCHNGQEVCENIAYNSEADRDNTADSVFCAKGAGYTVHWSKAKDAMQLEILE